MITPVDDTEYEYSLPDSHFLPLPPIEALSVRFVLVSLSVKVIESLASVVSSCGIKKNVRPSLLPAMFSDEEAYGLLSAVPETVVLVATEYVWFSPFVIQLPEERTRVPFPLTPEMVTLVISEDSIA